MEAEFHQKAGSSTSILFLLHYVIIESNCKVFFLFPVLSCVFCEEYSSTAGLTYEPFSATCVDVKHSADHLRPRSRLGAKGLQDIGKPQKQFLVLSIDTAFYMGSSTPSSCCHSLSTRWSRTTSQFESIPPATSSADNRISRTPFTS